MPQFEHSQLALQLAQRSDGLIDASSLRALGGGADARVFASPGDPGEACLGAMIGARQRGSDRQ